VKRMELTPAWRLVYASVGLLVAAMRTPWRLLSNSPVVVLRRWAPRVAASIGDQGLISGVGLLVNVVLARKLSVHDYGAFAVAFGLFLFVSGLHNAIVLEPLTVFAPAAIRRKSQGYVSSVLLLHFAVTAILAAATCATVWVIVRDPVTNRALMAMAICSPFTLLLWVVRRLFYAAFVPTQALIISASYAVLTAFTTVVLLRSGIEGAPGAFFALGLSSLIASVAGLGLAWRQGWFDVTPRHVLDIATNYIRYGRWLLVTAILALATNHIQTIIVAAVATVEDAGAVRAMMTFMLPMAQVVAAISTLGMPALARTRSVIALKTRARILTLGLLGVSLIYEVGLILFSGWMESAVYGGKFAEWSWLIPVFGLVPLIAATSTGASLVLRLIRRPQHYLWVGLAGALVGGASAIPLTIWWGVAGSAFSLVLAYVSAASCTLVLETLWTKDRRTLDDALGWDQ
jgi:O-antigen/teichoic acid export membrane protein